MGIIAMEGIEFYAPIGYYEGEQIIGNKFLVDVYMEDVSLEKAAYSDQLKHTINYENIYSIIAKEINQKSKLLEHTAQNIINAIHDKYSSVPHIKVRVSKVHPPLKGNVDRVFVELAQSYT